MSMESLNAKKPRVQHSTYLSCGTSFKNISHADRLNYKRAQQGCEELRRAMMRYYYKRNGVRL